MTPAPDELQAQLDELSRELAALRQRVAQLEAGVPRVAPSVTPRAELTVPAVAAPAPSPAASDAVGYLSIAGRTLMALGGAYLLRALTDAQVVSPAAGATLGFAYAAVFLLLCERDARRGRAASANFHGLTAVAIVFPLIAEAVTRFHILAPVAAALAVAALGGVVLGLAWRRNLRPLAWMAEIGALVTTVVLLGTTGAVMPFVLTTFFLCLAAEAVAFQGRFTGLRWPVALVLDLELFLLAILYARPEGAPAGLAPVSPAFAVVTLLALPALYTAGVASRRVIPAFGMFQGPMALAVGLWGTARVLTFHSAPEPLVGASAVLLAVATYGVAFLYAAPHKQRGDNYHYYSTLGGLLLLAGTAWMFDGAQLGLVWAVLALVAMALDTLSGRKALRLHAAILATLAAFATGLVVLAAEGLFGNALASWHSLEAAPVAGVLAVLLCDGVLIFVHAGKQSRAIDLIPRVLLGALAFFGVAGLLARGLGQIVADAPGAGADAGLLAATRTAVLATGAVALVALGRRYHHLPELRWFVPPVLIVGALKIAGEDFPRGRPLTQFVTLAVYGAALFIVPRMLRGKKPAAPPAS